MSKTNLNNIEIKKKIIEYAKNSLEMEEKRQIDIVNKANTNLMIQSILLVPLITIAVTLIDFFPKISIIISIFSIILATLLLTSMIFAIAVEWKKKQFYRRTASEYMDHLNTISSKIELEELYLDQEINDLDLIQADLITSNNNKNIFLKISVIIIYIFIGLLFVFGNIILILI